MSVLALWGALRMGRRAVLSALKRLGTRRALELWFRKGGRS